MLKTRKRDGVTDQLERYFADIDTPGCRARDRILNSGATKLSVSERADFARLLMSLQARRPKIVATARNHAEGVRAALDNDLDVVERFRSLGLQETPSDWHDAHSADGALHERSFERIMRSIVQNPEVVEKLINANWHTFTLEENDGTLVLGDYRELYT